MQRSSSPARVRPALDRGRRGTKNRDRGAVIVEAALVLPLILLVLFTIVDFGYTLNEAQAVRQGARDGGRAMAVSDFGLDTACPLNGLSSGPAEITKAVCQAKNRTNLPEANVRVRVALQSSGTCPSGAAATTSAPCKAQGDPIGVCVQYPVRSLSGIYGSLFQDHEHTAVMVFRLEKDLSFSPSTDVYSESALPGGDWSWCSNPVM